MAKNLNDLTQEAREIVVEVSTFVEAAVIALDEHPELVTNLTELCFQYFDVFRPLIEETASITIEMRKLAFEEFKAMGLSDELAVKLVCGR